MKTYWLMIGAIVVLTVAVVCVVSYQMSKPDSPAQPQSALQVQKQNADRGITDKKPVSKTTGLNPVKRPVVAPVHPVATVPGAGKGQMTKAKNRQFVSTAPQMRPFQTATAFY